MGFIERVLGEVRHLVKNFVRRFFVNTVGNRAGTLHRPVLIFQTVDEIVPLLLHDIQLFLRHRTAHKIGSSVRVAGHLAADFHNLLLIDHAAIGHRQDIPQKITFIGRPFGVMTVFNISVNRIGRSRAIKRNDRNQILKTFGLESAQYTSHARGFILKNAVGFTLGKHFVCFLVVHVNIRKGKRGIFAFYHFHGIVNDRQRA